MQVSIFSCKISQVCLIVQAEDYRKHFGNVSGNYTSCHNISNNQSSVLGFTKRKEKRQLGLPWRYNHFIIIVSFTLVATAMAVMATNLTKGTC